MSNVYSSALQIFAERGGDICMVLNLATTGLSHLANAVERAETVINWDNVSGKPMSGERQVAYRKDAAATAESAIKEASSGFHNLASQATVALWGALEVLVNDYVVESIELNPRLLDEKPFSKIQISIGIYNKLSDRERIEFLVKEADRELASKFRSGIMRFEALLAAILQPAELDKELRKTLSEMHSVRNLIVHRNGVVDRRFIESTPWLRLNIGDKIATSTDDFERYQRACLDYFYTLKVRYKAAECIN